MNFFSLIDEIFEKYKFVIHGSLIINIDRNFIFNMFAYLFSPIFYFKYLTNPMFFIFLLENFLIVLIFYKLIKNFNFKFKLENFIYFISFLFLLFITAETTTNAGIVLRQKWQFNFLYIYSHRWSKKNQIKKFLIIASSFITIETFYLNFFLSYQKNMMFLLLQI